MRCVWDVQLQILHIMTATLIHAQTTLLQEQRLATQVDKEY